ncbi:MAG: NHL repeat-containing protein [Thermomicrobiales bacterium]
MTVATVEGLFQTEIYSSLLQDGGLASPFFMAVDGNGDVWIADSGNNRIQKFSRDGQFLSGIGWFGTDPGQFQLPLGLAIAADGSIYVVDSHNHRVQQFSADGQFMRQFGAEGNGRHNSSARKASRSPATVLYS